MKKRFAIIFAIIFLLIPTYFIVSFLLSGSDTPINFREIKKTVIVSPSGKTFDVDYSENDAGSTLFYRMLSEKDTVSSIPSDMLKKEAYKVTFYADNYSSEYEYVLSSDKSQCYIISRKGVSVTYFKLNPSIADEFLSSEYCEGVYPMSGLPTLFIGGRQLSAKSGEWYYRNNLGAFREAKDYSFDTTNSNIGSVSADFELSFSLRPEKVTITLKDSDTGEVFYTGNADDVGNTKIIDNRNILLTVNASWGKDGDGYGEIVYEADARMFAPVYFFISEPQVIEGGVVVLSAKNVIDKDSVSFTVEPSLDYEPVFYRDGDYIRALMPIPTLGNGEVSEYKLSFSCDGTKKDLSLLVLPKENSKVTIYNVPENLLNEIGVKDNPYKSLFDTLSLAIAGVSNFETPYGKGVFTNGFEKGIVRAQFGTEISYSSYSKSTFISHDTVFVGNSTDSISAMNDGVVVYMGSTSYTGGLVIIDHGFGLLSWYWNIGKFADDVSVGNVVKKNQTIGYNGGGGLSESHSGKNISCHTAVTVFGTPIDPEGIRTTGLIIADK